MIRLQRTSSKNIDFIELVSKLNAYLAIINGDNHAFFDAHNKIENLNQAIVVYWNDIPVGCGAIKTIKPSVMEIKRMWVNPDYRGKHIATAIIKELEKWAAELGNNKLVLETSIEMKDAVSFYKSRSYKVIEKYGPYKNVETSICFKKILN